MIVISCPWSLAQSQTFRLKQINRTMNLAVMAKALVGNRSWEHVLITLLVLVALFLLCERRATPSGGEVVAGRDGTQGTRKRRDVQEGQYYLGDNLIQSEWKLDRLYTCNWCARKGNQNHTFSFKDMWNDQKNRYVTQCCAYPVVTRVPPPPSIQ